MCKIPHIFFKILFGNLYQLLQYLPLVTTYPTWYNFSEVVTISTEDFEKIYNTHYNNVAKVAYLIVLDRDYAQDIAQEVFMKLYKNVSNGNNIRNLQAWLYLTAKHTSIDFVRKYGKFRIIWLSKEIPTRKNYANDVIERTYLSSVLYDLRCKNKIWYDMLLMKYTLGLSTQEIAWRFRCSKKTVENCLRRARNYIKDQNGVNIEDMMLPLFIYIILRSSF